MKPPAVRLDDSVRGTEMAKWRRTVSGSRNLSGGGSRLSAFFAAHSHARLRRGRVRPEIAEPVLTGLPRRGFSHRELKLSEQGRSNAYGIIFTTDHALKGRGYVPFGYNGLGAGAPVEEDFTAGRCVCRG